MRPDGMARKGLLSLSSMMAFGWLWFEALKARRLTYSQTRRRGRPLAIWERDGGLLAKRESERATTRPKKVAGKMMVRKSEVVKR